MKKKLVAFAVVAAMIGLLLTVVFTTINHPSNFSALKNHIFEDKAFIQEVTENIKANGSENPFIVFLSICDIKTRARVFVGRGKTLTAAWENAERSATISARNNNFIVKWIKADVVASMEEADLPAYNRALAGASHQNFYHNGIAFDKDFQIAFLEAEVNGNKMVRYFTESKRDYDENRFNLNNINSYLKNYREGSEQIEKIPDTFIVFEARGFFQDENGTIYDLYSNTKDYGRRIIEPVSDKTAQDIVLSASEYLFRMIKEDGSFQYGYWPVSGNESKDYNILRHAGSIWSLIALYRMTGNRALQPKIKSALDYLVNECVKYENETTAFVVERESDEIKLGGNGLAIVALTEYMDAFQNDEYLELVRKLANGILILQNDDGSYIHVLNYPGFTKKANYRTVFYDGEATFGLTRAYTFTKEQQYLDAAAKGVNHFIAKDYTKYRDHWVAYALNEITKYIPSEEYYTFALQNVQKNLKWIYNLKTTSHIHLELLAVSWQTYQRLQESGTKVDYLKEFNVERFAKTIQHRAEFMLNGFFFPEVAMYMEAPERSVGTFFIRHDNYRIRIDDIQHFIGGYYWYMVGYEQIAPYLK